MLHQNSTPQLPIKEKLQIKDNKKIKLKASIKKYF